MAAAGWEDQVRRTSGTEGRREVMCPSVLPQLPTMAFTRATPSSSNAAAHAREFCRVIAVLEGGAAPQGVWGLVLTPAETRTMDK